MDRGILIDTGEYEEVILKKVIHLIVRREIDLSNYIL